MRTILAPVVVLMLSAAGPAAALDMMTWGSMTTVKDKLVALPDKVGPFDVLTMLAHEWDDPVFCQQSMRLLANDVMPVFARHAEQSAAACALMLV